MDTTKTAAVRRPKRRHLTDEQLLLIAIALVKASGEDGPNFVYEVAAVFQALKHNEESPAPKRRPSDL